MQAPLPPNEAARLQALQDYAILDTREERAYDDIVALAANVCDAPMALVSFVDADRQWFKARLGVAEQATPREMAFCAHAILAPRSVLLVPDATLDPRFADNPLVRGKMQLRFYAGTPLLAPGGEALGTLCVLDRVPRDLAPERLEALRALGRLVETQLELRRRNAQLAHGERVRSAFLSNVGHELRTPITSIRGSLGLILAGVAGELPAQAQRLLGIAQASCERLVRLLDDVADIERIASGRLELDLAECDLVAVARDAMVRLQASAAAREVSLRLERAPARADPQLLAQVLDNLVANAIRHSPGTGAVALAIDARAGGHRVSVRDDGQGVAPQFRERLFEGFSPASMQRPRGPDGTGLGLAICKSIIERLGGGIGFEPAEGGGALFYFDLPAVAGT